MTPYQRGYSNALEKLGMRPVKDALKYVAARKMYKPIIDTSTKYPTAPKFLIEPTPVFGTKGNLIVPPSRMPVMLPDDPSIARSVRRLVGRVSSFSGNLDRKILAMVQDGLLKKTMTPAQATKWLDDISKANKMLVEMPKV